MTVDIRRSRTNELAKRQHGAFSRAQALALGYSESQVDRRLATDQWEVLLPGVFKLAGTPRTGRQAAIAACCGRALTLRYRIALLQSSGVSTVLSRRVWRS
jgi:hypothetical protein